MGRRKKSEFPKATIHKASNRSRLRVCGHEVWLGVAGSPEAERRYRDILAAWAASGGTSIDAALDLPAAGPAAPSDSAPVTAPEPAVPAASPPPAAITVGTLILAYLEHVAAGRTKAELRTVSQWGRAREISHALFTRHHVPVNDFGPRMLREVRDELALTPKRYTFTPDKAHRARTHVNRLVREIVSLFRWGVSEQLVAVTTWQALLTTPHLKRGKSPARETDKREPAPDADVEKVLRHLPPVIADLIRFARLVACRPDEAARLRLADTAPAAGVLKWTLIAHKTAAVTGRPKEIPIGPRAEALARRWAAGKDPTEVVFARADRGRVRGPGMIATRPYRSPRQRFQTDEIRKAIHAACDLAGVTHWTPYQLRHAGLTAIRKKCGVEAEAAVAGWTTPKLAYHYAALSFDEAAAAARRLG